MKNQKENNLKFTDAKNIVLKNDYVLRRLVLSHLFFFEAFHNLFSGSATFLFHSLYIIYHVRLPYLKYCTASSWRIGKVPRDVPFYNYKCGSDGRFYIFWGEIPIPFLRCFIIR